MGNFSWYNKRNLLILLNLTFVKQLVQNKKRDKILEIKSNIDGSSRVENRVSNRVL